MDRPVLIEASVACANLLRLEDDLKLLASSGVDLLHIDIMDGHFVDNFCVDFSLMRAIGRVSDLPMECHLMVEEPERFIDRTIEAGAQYVSIHAEASRHLQHDLQHIRERGAKAGVALNPATPIDCLDYVLDELDMVVVMTVNPGFVGQKLIPATIQKIQDVRRRLDNTGHENVDIQVDGNVSFANIPAMVAAGANMLVGGTSSVFHKDYTIPQAVNAVKTILQKIETAQ
ncbi:MAG: ribulose-phosphate 3-epimerase [Acidobacteriaceae bacterium]|nr:ribulose-phosphate 3-epimerase [Acidobacteriaceae bacterium]